MVILHSAGKRYYLLQIQLQRNLFMTNENKNMFSFVKCVFNNPSIVRSIFSDRHTFLCKCFCNLYIVVTLEPALMHLFEPQVVSLSTENGNGSKLDFLLGTTYHGLRYTITRLIRAVWGQQTRIKVFMH